MKRISEIKVLITFLAFLALYMYSFSQITVILRPAAEGKDAIVYSRVADNNFGSSPDFAAMAWTYQSTPVYVRSLIDFDWSVIPSDAVINSAHLSLYSYDSQNNGTHSTLDGPNSSELRRIITNWDENTVTWNNQPISTTQSMVILPSSTNSIQDYLNIDVTTLVEDIFEDTLNSFGFLLKLETEQYYRSMLFASSDNSDSSLHPKLELSYSLPSDTCIILRPDSISGIDAITYSRLADDNFGSSPDFAAMAWTYQSTPVYVRSLINFDWSVIPFGAEINSAYLSLYSYDSQNNGTHSTLDGPNSSELRRITSYWDENTVTWNNQPTTTTQNMVILPSSTNSIQDYLNIDVSDLVQDIINDPLNSFGFLLKLETEQYYRSMLFASSDNSDLSIHPKLSICYTNNTSVINKELNSPKVYPNPFSEHTTIEIKNPNKNLALITIYDVRGNTIYSQYTNSNKIEFYRNNYPSGLYFFSVTKLNVNLPYFGKFTIE